MQENAREREVFFGELLETAFFQECMEQLSGQQNRQEGRCALEYGGMLLQYYYDEYYFSDKQKNILASAVEYLSDAFSGKGVKLNRKDVPVLIYLAELAQEKGVLPDMFLKWWVGKWDMKPKIRVTK